MFTNFYRVDEIFKDIKEGNMIEVRLRKPSENDGIFDVINVLFSISREIPSKNDMVKISVDDKNIVSDFIICEKMSDI